MKTALKTAGCIFALFLLLSACSGKERSSQYLSGSQKRSNKALEFLGVSGQTVYYTPAMEAVLVRENIAYTKDSLMDIYYPPNYDKSKKLPAVVFMNRIGGLNMKDTGRFMDWALSFAANGMIAVAYDCIYAEKDTITLLNYLCDNARKLGIDNSRLVIFGITGYAELGFRLLMARDQEYSDALCLGVFLFPLVPEMESIRTDIPLIIVRIGKHRQWGWNDALDNFVAQAQSLSVPIDLIDYREGRYAFDYFDSGENWIYYTSTFARRKDIAVVEDVLERMKIHLDL